MKSLKKFMASCMTIALTAGLIVSPLFGSNAAYAATVTTEPNGTVTGLTNPPTISGSSDISISKTLSATSAADQYKVTFSLPQTADVTEKTIDIVFCLDKSSTRDIKVNGVEVLPAKAAEMLEELYKIVNPAAAEYQPGVHFNVGVLIYGSAILASTDGMLELNETNKTIIGNTFTAPGGAGTSVHTGILKAQSWLDADTAVPNNQKYMINITDYAGYGVGLPGDDNGYFRVAQGKSYVGNDEFGLRYGGMVSSDPAVVSNQVDDLINNKILLNGQVGNKYLTTNGPAGSEDIIMAAPGANAMSPADFNSLQTPPMFEKSVYCVGNALKEVYNSGIHIMSVTLDYKTGLYHDYNKGFQKWISDQFGSDYFFSLSDNGYETNNYLSDSFKNITSKIINTLGKGTLTDTIGNYFTLHDYADIEVALDGTPLAKTQLTGSDDKNADASWGFGTADGSGAYPYELRYTAATQTFEWVLNNEVKNTQQLSFSYLIDLDKEKTDALTYGTYDLKSNASASIDYQDVTYEDGNPTYGPVKHVDFNSPYLTFDVSNSVVTDSFTLKKEWRGASASSQGDVQIQVYVDGVATGSPITLGVANNWTTDVNLATVSDATPSIATLSDASPSDSDEDGSLADGMVADDSSSLISYQADEMDSSSGVITIMELNVPDGFYVSYDYDEASKVYTVTNTYRRSSDSSSSSSSTGGHIAANPTLTPVSSSAYDDSISLYGLYPDGTPMGNMMFGGAVLPKTGDERNNFFLIMAAFGMMVLCASSLIYRRLYR